MTIGDLELSTRSRYGLWNSQYKLSCESPVSELCRLTPKDLLRIRNIGKGSVNEIEEALAWYGLGLAVRRRVISDSTEGPCMDAVGMLQQVGRNLEAINQSIADVNKQFADLMNAEPTLRRRGSDHDG